MSLYQFIECVWGDLKADPVKQEPPELRDIISEVFLDDPPRHLSRAMRAEQLAHKLIIHRQGVEQHAVHVTQQSACAVRHGESVGYEHADMLPGSALRPPTVFASAAAMA